MSEGAITDRLRIVADEFAVLGDLLRDDAIRTGELGEAALGALLAPELALHALRSPLGHAETVADLLALEALVGAHLARATARWAFVAQVGTAFQAADAMLVMLRPGTADPADTAWRLLLADLQLDLAALGPGLDVVLGATTAGLVAAGLPLAPKLPPAVRYPGDWGDEGERVRGFRLDLADVYGSAFPPVGMRLDAEGRIVPTTTESLLVSAAQAAKLGAPSAVEADGTVIRVVTYPTEPPTFVALLPGSAGFGFASATDWGYNATGGLPLQAAARDALDRAIAEHGAEAGAPPRVGLVGFSQGGIAALGLASGLGADYDVVLVETVGTPDLQDAVLPERTRVVSIADPDDPIPMLDGRSNPTAWEQVEVDAGGAGLEAHNELRYARALGARADDPIAELLARATGDPTMSDYFYTMR